MPRRKREPEPPRLVAVEGLSGTGKSSVAERWSGAVGARAVRLDADDNPFLSTVFVTPARTAFPAQMYFLLARHRQQLELRQGDLFAKRVVVEGVFARDWIHAAALLPPAELALYERIFRLLEPHAVAPDLLVALQSSAGPLLERLRARGRAYERAIDGTLLERLVSGLSTLYEGWTASPVLRVDVSAVELEERDDLLDAVVHEARRAAAELRPGERAELRLRSRA